jgi:hypothetical protein
MPIMPEDGKPKKGHTSGKEPERPPEVTYSKRECYIGMGNKSIIGPLARDAEKRAKRETLIVAAGAFCLGVVFLAAILILASCSASVSSIINSDGSARISVEAEMPTALAAKMRKLAGTGGSPTPTQESIFDADALRKSLAARPGLAVLELSQPNPDSIHVLLAARSVEDLAASPDLAGSKIIGIEKGLASTECRFRLERGDAKALSALFPGVEPRLMEALSPPALEEDPVSLAEYKTMLKSILGEKAMPAIEAAAVKLSITAPGQVLASGGGTLSSRTLTAKIPVVEILALEKPIEVWLRWKNAQ